VYGVDIETMMEGPGVRFSLLYCPVSGLSCAQCALCNPLGAFLRKKKIKQYRGRKETRGSENWTICGAGAAK
jgi:hypothetical protein